MSNTRIARGVGGTVLFSLTWIGAFFLIYNTLFYFVAGSMAAIIGSICFLIVYQTWHPRPIIKPLLVVAIIMFSKLAPYAYSDTLLERATSCAYGDPNFLAWSVASADDREVSGPTGLAVSVKHEKCYDWPLAAIPSFYFVFVHRTGERDNDSKERLIY